MAEGKSWHEERQKQCKGLSSNLKVSFRAIRALTLHKHKIRVKTNVTTLFILIVRPQRELAALLG